LVIVLFFARKSDSWRCDPERSFMTMSTGGPSDIGMNDLFYPWIRYAACQRERTPHDEFRIGYFKGRGESNREIARKVDKSHTCVNNYLKKHDPRDKPSVIPLELPPKVVLDLCQLAVVKEATVIGFSIDDREESCRRLSDHLELYLGMMCSKSAISRIRRENGLRNEFTRKTEHLTSNHILNRASWATNIQASEAFNLPWIITDECMIVSDPIRKKVWLFP
jgi:hypothetical protein